MKNLQAIFPLISAFALLVWFAACSAPQSSNAGADFKADSGGDSDSGEIEYVEDVENMSEHDDTPAPDGDESYSCEGVCCVDCNGEGCIEGCENDGPECDEYEDCSCFVEGMNDGYGASYTAKDGNCDGTILTPMVIMKNIDHAGQASLSRRRNTLAVYILSRLRSAKLTGCVLSR